MRGSEIDDGTLSSTYKVTRPYPNVIAVWGKHAPLMDLHGLMREWHHGGWAFTSLALAKSWGATLVVCRSSGDEYEILEHERGNHKDQGS